MNPRKRARPGTRAGLAVAVASTLTLLSGCAQVVDGQAVREAPQIGAPVEWHPCAFTDAAPDYLRSGQCGTITVPVNYDKPDDGIVTLALIRFPATGDKIGSLVINPGGPGESGLEAAMNLVQGMPEAIRQRFDLVGFDPRGVARSKPALWCNSDADNDKSRADQLRGLIRQFPPGAVQFEVGIQTFDDATSKNISRRQNLDRLADNFRFLREETGVHIHADLIVGLPGEDIESFGRGFDRLVRLGPQEIQVGILKHKVIDQLRRHTREATLTTEDDEQDLDELLFAQDGHWREAPKDWGDPEHQLRERQFFDVLEACVSHLPATQGRVFMMREWLELDTAEICKELQITTTNLWVLLHRARLRLRECLQLRWFDGQRAPT